MHHDFELVSHPLCPYVQRAAITLAEKGIAFRRTDIDLADKPDWFRAISPLGKVPLLRLGGADVLFESSAICEFLDEIAGPRLHPADPVTRARHRAWMEVASSALSDLAGLYSAPDEDACRARLDSIGGKFAQVDAALHPGGPYFAGTGFSLVDAAFAPVFRYFDLLDPILPSRPLAGLERVKAWRRALSLRPSVTGAVAADYPARLRAFLRDRKSWLSLRLPATAYQA